MSPGITIEVLPDNEIIWDDNVVILTERQSQDSAELAGPTDQERAERLQCEWFQKASRLRLAARWHKAFSKN
jgi:hypothetical protein